MSVKSEGLETGTLGKTMAVLEAISAAPAPMRFTDLLGQVAQPRGTLHRQISNLVAEGLLAQRSDLTYELGPRLLKLASSAWSSNHFRVIAEPHLAQLHAATGETIHLGILSGHEIIYLDKVESKAAVRMHSQIGNVSPIYCTGVGKAAASGLAPVSLDKLADRLNFHQFTAATITSKPEFIAAIGKIKDNGIAYDREEHEAGIACVAAPVISANGVILAGVSITAPTYRVSMEQFEQWAPLVKKAAARITEDIATRLGPKV